MNYGVQFVVPKMELFLIYSGYLLAKNTLTSTRCKRRSAQPRVERSGTLGVRGHCKCAL